VTSRKQPLTEDTIRQYVGAESFRRGEHYFRDGMIFNVRRTDAMLKADCHGLGGNIYRVHATVADGTVADADCSCPVGGHCKHIAALLLTWLNQPNDFRKTQDTNAALEQRSKEELIALVKQMLLRAPDLESLLELPLPTGKKSKKKIDAETYRRQVAAAFGGSDFEYGAAPNIANELSATLGIADGFLAQGEVDNAVTVYEAIANGVVENYETVDDESGALGGIVQDCVAGLSKCLEDEAAHADTALREKIYRALFEVYRFDVNFGGVGLSDGVPDLILKRADDAEKEQVAGWIRMTMNSSRRASNELSNSWGRQAYGGFLLQLEADVLDNDAYLRLCRETHRLNDLVERLLRLKRLDEARDEAAHADDYELLALADIFAQHKQGEVAERLMIERAQTTQDTRIFEWLMERSRKSGDHADALMWARRINAVRPSLEQYREIRKLAKTVGTWESVRTELLADLEEHKDFGLLTQIHLDEKEIDAALETVEKIQGGYVYFSPDLRLQVAKAAEETRPRHALRIYLQAAEPIVKARNRGAYSEACRYLVRVRTLYQKLGEDAAWEQYLRKLKEETKAMRAFKEEMAKAKL
jgi:uncharacterized Zn finger protein